MAMGPAIIARTFGPGERGKALGLNAVSVAIGLSLGPALGGILTEVGTWRAIFLVNLPVGIFAIAVGGPRPAGRAARGSASPSTSRAPCSPRAACSRSCSRLSQGESMGLDEPARRSALLALALGLGVVFVIVERRTAAPLMDLALFRIRAFTAGSLAVVVAFAGLFTATFLLPFLLQEGSGYTPLQAGLLLTPIPIAAARRGALQRGRSPTDRPAAPGEHRDRPAQRGPPEPHDAAGGLHAAATSPGGSC